MFGMAHEHEHAVHHQVPGLAGVQVAQADVVDGALVGAWHDLLQHVGQLDLEVLRFGQRVEFLDQDLLGAESGRRWIMVALPTNRLTR